MRKAIMSFICWLAAIVAFCISLYFQQTVSTGLTAFLTVSTGASVTYTFALFLVTFLQALGDDY